MKAQNYKWESIRSITPAGRAKTVCIAVDAPDKLYASADGILCHNTSGDPQSLPPAYIDRSGRMTYLNTTPKEDQDIAALFAPILQQPRPNFDKIFARATREIRQGVAQFARDFDTSRWIKSQATNSNAKNAAVSQPRKSERLAVPQQITPRTQDVSASELDRDAIALSNLQLEEAKREALDQAKKLLKKLRQISEQLQQSYETPLKSQQATMFAEGDWLLHPDEDDILIGFRGEGEGGKGATEGIGLYIAKDRSTAAFFGTVRHVNFPIPQKTLLIDQDTKSDPLPLLNEEDDDLWADILSYQEKPDDSDWIKAHKRAAKKIGLSDNTWGERIDAFPRALTNEMLNMGYDSVLTRSGGEEWIVLLARDNQWLEQQTTEAGTKLYSQATDPIERLRDLLNQAYAETARGGVRTIGDWQLAHSMDNELWMAADAYHRETQQAQTDAEWQAIADHVLAMDYEAARLGLVAKLSANEQLTPPETKMAETILQREMAKPMTPEQAGRVMVFAVGLRRSRAETARTLTALRDPHRTPIERWRAWMGDVLFQPSKKAKKMMKNLPTEAKQRAEINALREKIRELQQASNTEPQEPSTEANADARQLNKEVQAHIANLEALIKQLESTPTQEAVAASDAAEKLARIEAILAKNGVTIEDLQKGVTEVRLIGSRLIADVASTFGNRDRQIIALTQMNRGGTFADIAKRFDTTENDIKQVYATFTEKLYEATLQRIQRGIDPEQLADVEYKPTNIAAQPEIQEATPEQKEKALAALRMMGFAKDPDEQTRLTYRRRSGKRSKKSNKKPPSVIIAPEWARPIGEGKELSVLLEEARKRGIEWERPIGEGRTRGDVLDLRDNDPYDWVEGRFDPENIEERLPMMRDLAEAAHGSTWWDYLSEIRVANLLSGPVTLTTNASAVFYAVYKSIFQRGIEAGLNAMQQNKAIDAATFAEFAPLFRALGNTMGRALTNAVLAFQTEVPVTENMRFNMQGDMLSGQFDENLGRMPGKFGRIMRIGLRALMAYDEWLKTLIAHSHAATLAYRRGRAQGFTGKKLQRFIEVELGDSTSDIWSLALEEARHQTFQTKLRSFVESSAKRKSGEYSPLRRILDLPENFMEAIQKAKQDSGPDAGVPSLLAIAILRFNFPFIKTPYNLFKIGAGLTPLSLIIYGPDALRLNQSVPSMALLETKALAQKIAKLQKDLRAARSEEAKNRIQDEINTAKKSFEAAKQQVKKIGNGGKLQANKNSGKVIQARAQIIASAITSTIFAAFAEGDENDDEKWILITGSYKTNSLATRGGRSLDQRTAPRYSIRIGGPGGLLISYQRIDPFSVAIATVVDATAEFKRAIRTGEWYRVSVPLSGFIRQFGERASTQGIAAAISYMTGNRALGTQQIGEAIGQSISPNLIRSTLRNLDPFYRDTESLGENLLAHLQYAMWPSEDIAPPPRLNIYGEPTERPGSFISRWIIPANPHMQPEYSPADVTLRNYMLQNPALRTWAPTNPSTKDTMRRYGIDARAAYRLNKARGEIFAKLLKQEGLTNLRRPTPSQIDKLRDLHEKSLTQARKTLGVK